MYSIGERYLRYFNHNAGLIHTGGKSKQMAIMIMGTINTPGISQDSCLHGRETKNYEL